MGRDGSRAGCASCSRFGRLHPQTAGAEQCLWLWLIGGRMDRWTDGQMDRWITAAAGEPPLTAQARDWRVCSLRCESSRYVRQRTLHTVCGVGHAPATGNRCFCARVQAVGAAIACAASTTSRKQAGEQYTRPEPTRTRSSTVSDGSQLVDRPGQNSFDAAWPVSRPQGAKENAPRYIPGISSAVSVQISPPSPLPARDWIRTSYATRLAPLPGAHRILSLDTARHCRRMYGRPLLPVSTSPLASAHPQRPSHGGTVETLFAPCSYVPSATDRCEGSPAGTRVNVWSGPPYLACPAVCPHAGTARESK
jgi:hypothetical protein